jgi:hypothetical protein
MPAHGNPIRSRLLAGGVFVVLLALTSTTAAAQTWRAERQRLEAEAARIVEKARDAGATDLPGLEAEFARLHAEYLEKVVKPALAEARTCGQRMEAVELAIGIERQAQLLGTSIIDAGQLATLLSGAYADQMFERCMNELYRACVVEDNPLYTRTMVAWAIGWERQKQLLGAPATGVDLSGELDPRITKCRGPWYQLRIVVERSGTEPDLGPWRDRDVSEGWLGRGLARPPARLSQNSPHPGDFTRRAEQLGYGARCPDGGCGGSCAFTAVMEGRARVEYELETSHEYRMLTVAFREGEGEEKLASNSCPHTDLPVSFYPGAVFSARFPADVVTPLVQPPDTPPGGADPKVTEALDEWPRMFEGKVVELDDEWDQPLGRLEVQLVCDGQEIWGRGSGECRQKWQAYLKLFGDETPLPPWQRKREVP